jgi:D-tyrosyl-tRNA(Tyr) deacylase
MRIFEDENGLINSDLDTIQGEALVISQFTLIASTKKGNRPSFNDAADPQKGNDYYLRAVEGLEKALDRPVKTGVFAANMQVSLVNDGPVTITLNTRHRE